MHSFTGVLVFTEVNKQLITFTTIQQLFVSVYILSGWIPKIQAATTTITTITSAITTTITTTTITTTITITASITTNMTSTATA